MTLRRTAVIVLVAVGVVAAGFVGVFALGLGPVPSGDGIGAEDSESPPEYEGDDDVEDVPFAFTVDHVEDCGTTCRDVTGTIVNTDDETATDVSVEVQAFVENDRIWQGTERIGTLEPGEDRTVEKRVTISYRDGIKILNNDGYVTVRTTVTSSEGSWTFSERWKLA